MGKKLIVSIKIAYTTNCGVKNIEFRTIMSVKEYAAYINRAPIENIKNCRKMLDNPDINFSPDTKIIEKLRYIYIQNYLNKSSILRDILENMEGKNSIFPRFQVNASTFELCLCIEQLQVHCDNPILKCSISSSFKEDHPCSRENCKNISTQTCTGCLSIRYCSETCQKEHWNIHKMSCICSKK